MNTIIKFFIALLLIIASGFVNNNQLNSSDNNATTQIILTTPEGEGILTEYIREVYLEVSKRTGIKFIIKEVPGERAIINANNGTEDGVAMRLRGLEKEYSNLKIVDVSILTVKHIIFANKREIIENGNDLQQLTEIIIKNNYLIGYIRGSVKAKKELDGFPDNCKVELSNPEQGLRMLDLDRIQAFLAGPGIITKNLLKTKFHTSKIKEAAVISEFPLYTYLHKKHNAIIPELEKALQSMKDDGTLDKIRNTYEN